MCRILWRIMQRLSDGEVRDITNAVAKRVLYDAESKGSFGGFVYKDDAALALAYYIAGGYSSAPAVRSMAGMRANAETLHKVSEDGEAVVGLAKYYVESRDALDVLGRCPTGIGVCDGMGVIDACDLDYIP